MTLHIEEYIKLLERGNQQKFKQNIEDVESQADKCNLCAVCRGCSKSFIMMYRKAR